jgi:DNA-binding XRE family transcriptional regulator
MEINAALKQKRIEMKLTRREAAFKIDRSVNHYCEVERGDWRDGGEEASQMLIALGLIQMDLSIDIMNA